MQTLKKALSVSLLAFAASALPQAALASDGSGIRLFESTLPWVDRVHAHFEINEDLGRAWVKLVIQEDDLDDDDLQFKRVAVPGLTFDAASRQVVLEKNGHTAVCARQENRRFMGIPFQRMTQTGECQIETRSQTVSEDNGFFIAPRTLTITTLNIVESTQSS